MVIAICISCFLFNIDNYIVTNLILLKSQQNDDVHVCDFFTFRSAAQV